MDKIIACIDREAGLATVADHAAWAAERLGGELQFLHVFDRQSDAPPLVDLTGSIGFGAHETLLSELSQLDTERSKFAQEHGRLLIDDAKARAGFGTGLQRHGTLVDTLSDLQAQTQLIVMGQHHQAGELAGRHLDHSLESVVRALHRPLLVAAQAFVAQRSCVVGFDGSAAGRAMVQAAATSPLLAGLTVHVVTAAKDSTEIREQLAWADGVFRAHGTIPVTAVLDGHADDALVPYALREGLELLVIGAYGHSRIRHLIVGSTTTTILRTSPLAVLVLR